MNWLDSAAASEFAYLPKHLHVNTW